MHMAVHYPRDPIDADHVFDEVRSLESFHFCHIWLIHL